MAEPSTQEQHIEVSIAVLTEQMKQLTEATRRIEASVDRQIAEKRVPWPQVVGVVMLLMSPAAGLYWHFESAITELRLVDRDSANERRDLYRTIAEMKAEQLRTIKVTKQEGDKHEN